MEPAAGRGTRGHILRLLRLGELTAGELAESLGVTPNAVRFHVAALERDGLVGQRPVRRGPRKPSYGYSLTPAGEALFPKRYEALLNAVLQEVRAGRDSGQVAALFRRAGRRLVAGQGLRSAALPPDGRAAAAARLVADLGGAAEIASRPGGVTIAGATCPFAAVVAEHPEACATLEGVLGEVWPEASIREACQKGGAPRCRFDVTFP